MKNNLSKKAIVLGIFIVLPTLICGMNVKHDKEKNIIEFIYSLFVADKPVNNQLPTRGVLVLTPAAPYNHSTFIVNIPLSVSVGQQFVVDYAIKNANFTHIPFWADLVPDAQQKSAASLSVIHSSFPTIGAFDVTANSVAQKGGKGVWQFPNGIPGGSMQHLTVTLKANSAGLAQFTTLIATNPPSYLGPVSVLACDNPPIANPDTASGSQDSAIVISVLDNDSGCSPLNIISVTQPNNGTVSINADNTLTYIPNSGFVGSDSLSYIVQDAGGQKANGSVAITVVA